MAGELEGKTVLVTAGPTYEFIDEVRFLGNPSTGRMGIELAIEARDRGATVHLVCGPTHLRAPDGVSFHSVTSAVQMYEAVEKRFDRCDVFIASSAVGDYRPASRIEGKFKKGPETLTLELVKNPDILKSMGERRKEGQVIAGFSLETSELLKHGHGKLIDKHCQLMFINSPHSFGQGRGSSMLIHEGGVANRFDGQTKMQLSNHILDCVEDILGGRELPVIEAFEQETP
ncbi:MAG: phosphopantothenoylcysteine decarboxylase domain-containing protein [Planctomycetota bacterium]|jgi:phosphopantothenoylcysteine decarboxylase/phosphopantothenate--cysteine ligase